MNENSVPYTKTDHQTCKPGVGNLRPAGRMRSAQAFYPARDLLLSSGRDLVSFFNNRYAAIKRRNDSHLIFWSLPSIQPKKCLNFWRRPFFRSSPSICPTKDLDFWRRPFFFGPLEWWRPAGTLLGVNVAH